MYEALRHQADNEVHVHRDSLVVELCWFEVGFLDRFHDPRIPVGANWLGDLDVLGLALAVDGERQFELGVGRDEGPGKAVRHDDVDWIGEFGTCNPGAHTNLGGWRSGVIGGRAGMGRCGEENRREHKSASEDRTHMEPPEICWLPTLE